MRISDWSSDVCSSDLVRGLDIMIVRELTGGVYFGQPRGIETLPNGERRGINTQVYTTSEIRRVAAVAFELAQKRGNKVTSLEKANVMESGVLWREEVTKLQIGREHVCTPVTNAQIVCRRLLRHKTNT